MSNTVTTPGSRSPPTICGLNTGQHMFLDSSSACNILSFNIGKTCKRRQFFIYMRKIFQCTLHSIRVLYNDFAIGKWEAVASTISLSIEEIYLRKSYLHMFCWYITMRDRNIAPFLLQRNWVFATNSIFLI